MNCAPTDVPLADQSAVGALNRTPTSPSILIAHFLDDFHEHDRPFKSVQSRLTEYYSAFSNTDN